MTERPRQRVTEVWTWLPAFRAVAEREHVQAAARALHVTASSLSRSIRLLEEHVGKRLFDRVGRNIRLNHDGAALLSAVGEAMRRVDDGIALVTGTTLSGELRVGCEGDQPLELVWRAASRLMTTYPNVTTVIEEVVTRREVADRLSSGHLDVAVLTSAPAGNRLDIERVGEVTYGIYCGEGHPLFGKRSDLDTISKYPFVAPAGDDEGPGDQWPKEKKRRVALRLPALDAAISACASGAFLAVIPDSAATPNLFRLPSDSIPASPLYVVRRRDIGGDAGKAGAFVTELRAAGVTAPRGRRPKRAVPSRRAKR